MKILLAFPIVALGAVVHEPTIDGLSSGLTRGRGLPLAIATALATARVGTTIVLAISLGLELGACWAVGEVVRTATLEALGSSLVPSSLDLERDSCCLTLDS